MLASLYPDYSLSACVDFHSLLNFSEGAEDHSQSGNQEADTCLIMQTAGQR